MTNGIEQPNLPILNLPSDFLWGAATAAHQVEGNNNNDWTIWEKHNYTQLATNPSANKFYTNGPPPNWEDQKLLAANPNNYLSGRAVDHWNRWREDIDLAKSFGFNALRYSLEWSRIQPNAKTFDEKSLDHYRQYTEYCIDKGITPFITLHHFTNPIWLSEIGGWENSSTPHLFNEYVNQAISVMPKNKGIHYLIINEPNVYAGGSYITGEWPPNKTNPLTYRKVQKNLIKAHKIGYQTIKDIDNNALVSSTVNYTDFEPRNGPFFQINKLLAWTGEKLVNSWFYEATIDQTDFIALNHYMHCVTNLGFFKNDTKEPRSDMGWYLNPDSMYRVLKGLAHYKKPIIITENGLADAKDTYRSWFIAKTLVSIQKAINEDIDIRGYLHWSLMDNFEWNSGWWPKFGLIEIDRQTMERKPRPSAYFYKSIIENINDRK